MKGMIQCNLCDQWFVATEIEEHLVVVHDFRTDRAMAGRRPGRGGHDVGALGVRLTNQQLRLVLMGICVLGILVTVLISMLVPGP